MNLIVMILAAVAVAILLAFVIVKFVPLKLRWLVSILLLVASVFLVIKIYDGIMEPIKFNQEKKVRYAKVIEQLKLIRDAEVKYNEAKGTYAANKQSLINFIENDSLVITEILNVTEKQVRAGGIEVEVSKKKIDTTGYERASKYFEGKDYKNMFKVPGTEKEFVIATDSIEKVTGFYVPVFEAKTEKKDILEGLPTHLVKQELEAVETDQVKGAYISVGSLTEVSTGGNWPPSYDKADAKADSEK